MENRKRKAHTEAHTEREKLITLHATNDKEEVLNKKRKTQTNTPTKSTTSNSGNNRKKTPTKSSNIQYKANIGRQRRRIIHQ